MGVVEAEAVGVTVAVAVSVEVVVGIALGVEETEGVGVIVALGVVELVGVTAILADGSLEELAETLTVGDAEGVAEAEGCMQVSLPEDPRQTNGTLQNLKGLLQSPPSSTTWTQTFESCVPSLRQTSPSSQISSCSPQDSPSVLNCLQTQYLYHCLH